MTNKTTTPRIPSEAWEKSKVLAIKLSSVEGKRVSAGEANRRAVELAIRNLNVVEFDAKKRSSKP